MEPNLPLDQVIEVARGMEAAEQNTRSLEVTEDSIVAMVSQQPQSPPPQTASATGKCYRCARAGHNAFPCRFREAITVARKVTLVEHVENPGPITLDGLCSNRRSAGRGSVSCYLQAFSALPGVGDH